MQQIMKLLSERKEALIFGGGKENWLGPQGKKGRTWESLDKGDGNFNVILLLKHLIMGFGCVRIRLYFGHWNSNLLNKNLFCM